MQMQGTASAGMQPSGDSAPPAGRRRDRGFAIVLLLVVLAAVPGVLLKLDAAPRSVAPLAQWLAVIGAALEDIKFGGGLRFWLGVGGVALMAMPLLYPLRKLVGLARFVGVAAWFDLHVVCGLLGPLLILYHCNMGLGSTPANVALGTMLIVVASGIIGHFLHARLSARYYRIRSRSRDRLATVIAATRRLPPGSPRERFVEELQRFDTIATERHAAPAATIGVSLRVLERDLLERAAWLTAMRSRATGSSSADALQRPLHDYFADVSRMERGRAIERLWSYWRLAHLPVVLIMVIAAAIHVGKVWGMDDAAPLSREVTSTQAAAETPSIAPRAGPVTVRAIRTVGVAAGSSEVKATAEPRPLPPPPAPRLVERRAAATPAAKVVTDAPPVAIAAPEAPATAAPVRDTAPKAIAEPERRIAQTTRGTFEPSAVLARLKQFRGENFDHGRTDFALTGKHATAKCESCHKTTLKDTGKDCIACHRKDDVHRGRRSDCAQCHVTSDWNRIVRRR